MDWTRPERVFGPSLDVSVLRALWRSGSHLTGAQVHRLTSSGSERGVRYALQRLVSQGIVSMWTVGASHVYALNNDHLTFAAVDAAFRALDPWAALVRRVDELVGSSLPPRVDADGIRAPEVTISVFGSVARGTADDRSDLDVLVVMPDDAPGGEHLSERLEVEGRRWTGQQVQVYLTTRSELARARDTGDPVVASFRTDARRIHGPAIDDLLQPAA